MAHAKSLIQGTGLAKSVRSSGSSDDAIKTYVDEVIRLFLSDLANHIKGLRRKQRSRASKTIVQFFYALAKSAHPIADLHRLGIDTLKDFGDFLQGVSQTLQAELLNGNLKSHDVLTQNLEPTAQFLSESLAALESRKDLIKILSDYVEHAAELELADDTPLATVAEESAMPQPGTIVAEPFTTRRRVRPAFVKTTCNPDFGFSFAALFSTSISVPPYAVSNGNTLQAPAIAMAPQSSPAPVSSESSATPAAIRQFVTYLAEGADARAQKEPISHIILRTLTKLSHAPDVFAELSALGFVPGLKDFTDFLLSQKQASSDALSRALADEVLTHLLGLFNAVMSQSDLAAQLTRYAESAPLEVDDILSLLDTATPPPAPAPPAELPKLDSLSELTQDLEPTLPNDTAISSPTESDYINYVTHILTRVQAQVKPDSSGYEQLSALLHSPDILAALSQTDHDWLKEFASFIGESWLNRVPIEKLYSLADEIVNSLAAALSSSDSTALAEEPIDSELDNLLSSLKPPSVPETEEVLPKLPAEALAHLTEEIEEAISLPSPSESDEPTSEIAPTPPSELAPSLEAAHTSSSDTEEDFGLPAPGDLIDSDLSDTLASLADMDDLNFQIDAPDEPALPNYVEIAKTVLRQVQASLPRTDAGKFASDFFENLLNSEDLLEALQTASLSPIRDVGNYILSANQSKPTEEAFRSRLSSKANEAIGLLFAEFEQHHLQTHSHEEDAFSPTDFLDDSSVHISAEPQLPKPDDLLVPVFSNPKPDDATPEASDLALDALDEQLFDNLNALSNEVLLESPSTPDSPSEIALTPLEDTAPVTPEQLPGEPTTLEALPDSSLTALEDTALATPEHVQDASEAPSSSLTDATGSEDLLLNADLLANEFLLDESLLSDASLEQPDTQKSELSSLRDLSSKAATQDEPSDAHLGDSLLMLDDSAFLSTDALLDDTALLPPSTDDSKQHPTPTTASSEFISEPELDSPTLSLPELSFDEPSTVSESTLLDEPLQEPQDASGSMLLDDSLDTLPQSTSESTLLDEPLQMPQDVSDSASLDTGALDLSLLDDTSMLLEETAAPTPPAAPVQEPAAKFVPDELQQIFLEEATEYLEKLNEDLLELDKVADTQQPDLVNRVLRGSHTIKGSAAMVQLRNISDLAHKMEDSLQLVRDKNLKASKALIDVLFQSADAIGDMLKTFRTTGKDDHPKKDDLVAILRNYTEQLEQFGEIRTEGIAEPKVKFVPNELQQIFLEEATEYLEKLNEDLLELDKVADTQQPDLVNRVLRGSHTIKGSAAMVQLRNISDLAHKMEDSLQLVRDKNLKASKALIDVLFQSADAIGDMLKTFRTTGKDDHPKKDDLVAILRNYTEQLEQFGEIRTVLSLAELQENKAVEAVEVATQQRRTQSVAEQTVRIDIRALNSLVNLSAELVIARNRLNNELLAFNKSINRFNKERLHLAQISKKIQTMIQKGSKESGALASFSDVLKEFSDTEFDRFSELDIISRDVKSAILNFDESISELKSIGSLLNQNVVKVSSIANDLNREIVGMRMVPVKQMFTRFSRSVRDIAKSEQKEINLVTEGEDTKLDKTVMEEVIEPIMHIVRNAIGHGIETPDVRRAHGKSPVGTITLRAYQKGSRVILEVEDDGGGINIEKVKAKAVKIGLITPEEAEKMTPAEATELIFRPGFSTADKITELQGRGVGMDVVQNTIRRLKGTTNIETVSGKGTKFIISLPLTLAIGDALLVTALDQTYAIPLEPVLETSYISTDIIEQDEDGKRYITLRDERIELRYLNDILGYQSDVLLFKAKVAVVVIKLEEEQKKVAVAVEKLIGKEEIVVKTLGKHLRNVRGVIGSTILGDGQVIIILDIEYLLRSEESRSRDVYVSVDNSAVETISPSTEPAIPTIKRRRRKGAKITVLHADDSPSVRKYVQSILKNADITVISADDGLAALNRLPTANVDLVISDLEMPRMNGFELVSEIRRMPEYQDLPIVIVTARAGDKHRRTGLELGANAFLNKPFDPQQLIETIESFVS
jgi:chemotaxis protein histidine kinase CheA